jgi:hypothetical protein
MPDQASETSISRRGVELVKVGQWPAVTGPADITLTKLDSMVRASQADWYDGAAMKLGHFDPRFDGEPALGWVTNLRLGLSADGKEMSLYGDLANVPPKVDEIIPTAFANRSIEWIEDVTAPDGTVYPAVMTGLALLGASPPGVSGLAPIRGLDDVVELFAAGAGGRDNLTRHSAFVGEHSEALVNALAAVDEIIRTSDDGTSHDMQRSGEIQEDQDMTDTLDSQLRTLLDLSAEDDITAAITDLKTKATTVETPGDVPSEGDEPTAEPVAPPTEPTPEAPSEPAAVMGLVTVQTTQAHLDDLTAKANQGAEAMAKLTEQEVDRELKAASRKIAPTEFPTLREHMLKGDSERQFVRQMLAARPEMVHTGEIGSSSDANPTPDQSIEAAMPAVREFLNFGGK